MPKVPRDSSRASKKTLIYMFKGRRVLGTRHECYDETIETGRTLFNIPMDHHISLESKDVEDADGFLVEIPDQLWEEVVPGLKTITVSSKAPSESQTNEIKKVRKIRAPHGNPGGMKIIVRSEKGEDSYFSVSSSNTVEDIKDMYQGISGMQPDKMRLIFAGKQLEDSRLLSDYNIEHLCTIHLVPRLVGGKPVIYLFSPEKIEATVKLSLVKEWSVSVVYPVVPIKPPTSQTMEQIVWRVVTHPNGDLTELNTGLDVSYLFWEALSNHELPDSPPASPNPSLIDTSSFNPADAQIDDSNAVVLSVGSITPYLDASLKALGLHTEARTSFITYWLPSLLKHKTVALRFLPHQFYSKAAPLDVSPAPDVVTRIFMIFRGVKDSELSSWAEARRKATDFSIWIDVVGVDAARTLDQTLFRVIEWGGMEVI